MVAACLKSEAMKTQASPGWHRSRWARPSFSQTLWWSRSHPAGGLQTQTDKERQTQGNLKKENRDRGNWAIILLVKDDSEKHLRALFLTNQKVSIWVVEAPGTGKKQIWFENDVRYLKMHPACKAWWEKLAHKYIGTCQPWRCCRCRRGYQCRCGIWHLRHRTQYADPVTYKSIKNRPQCSQNNSLIDHVQEECLNSQPQSPLSSLKIWGWWKAATSAEGKNRDVDGIYCCGKH